MWTRHDKTWQDMTRHDKTWQDMTRHDKTWQDMTRHDKTWQDMTILTILRGKCSTRRWFLMGKPPISGWFFVVFCARLAIPTCRARSLAWLSAKDKLWGYPKSWMVYNEKKRVKWMIGDTLILGNHLWCLFQLEEELIKIVCQSLPVPIFVGLPSGNLT